jgi:hypothetical protein
MQHLPVLVQEDIPVVAVLHLEEVAHEAVGGEAVAEVELRLLDPIAVVHVEEVAEGVDIPAIGLEVEFSIYLSGFYKYTSSVSP